MTVKLTDDDEYELTKEQYKALSSLYKAIMGSLERAMKEAKDNKVSQFTVDDIKMNVEFVEMFIDKLKLRDD